MSLLDQYRESIFSSLFQSDYGLFRRVGFSPKPGYCPTISNYAIKLATLTSAEKPTESLFAFGCDISPKKAVLKAIYEGLERIAIWGPIENSFGPSMSYSEVKDLAYTPHPTQWTLCDSWQYDEHDFPLVPFEETTKVRWVELVHAWKKEKTWVPIDFVYLSHLADRRLYFTSSSGCAFSWNYDDACSAALLELIERDTFLLYWRCFLSPLRIILDNINNENLRNLWNSICVKNGQIKVFFLEGEFLIPVICSVFIGENNHQPVFKISSAASFCIEEAIYKSLLELFQHLAHSKYSSTSSRVFEMESENMQIRNFQDRGDYYSFPENLHSLSFFFESDTEILLSEMKKTNFSHPKNIDMLIQEFKSRGYDLMYKSFVTPELNKIGGHVVRAICPPLIPLDAPHQIRALGGDRYFQLLKSKKLGVTVSDSRSLYQKPHPLV